MLTILAIPEFRKFSSIGPESWHNQFAATHVIDQTIGSLVSGGKEYDGAVSFLRQICLCGVLCQL